MGLALSEGTFGYKEEDNVVVLTDSNLSEAIAKFEYILVEFYAPWCGHCKKLAPEYSKAAATLKGLENPIPLAKVDATENGEGAKKYGVQGYPTIKFFVSGEPIDFNGGRTADDIVNWIKKKTGPASTLLGSAAEVTETEKSQKVFLTYFSAGQASEDAFNTYKQVALKYDDIQFFHVDDEALYQKHGNAQRVAIYTQHAGEYTFLPEGQDLTVDNVVALIDNNRFPLVMEFEGDEAIARIFNAERTALFFFSDNKSHDFLSTFTALAEEDAANTAQPLIFSTSTLTSGLGQRLAEFVGAKSSEGETVWVVKPGQSMEKYKYSGELTKEGVAQFVAQWREGSLERHLKSQEPPASNSEPVKVVVGKTFDDIVINNDNWVLLEFYAPWCGHCKKLAPIYDELAKELSYIDNLTIAKIDATENEVPSVSVQGFPTLKLFKPGSKTAPLDFDGDRTLEGLTKTLKEKMGADFKEKSTDL